MVFLVLHVVMMGSQHVIYFCVYRRLLSHSWFDSSREVWGWFLLNNTLLYCYSIKEDGFVNILLILKNERKWSSCEHMAPLSVRKDTSWWEITSYSLKKWCICVMFYALLWQLMEVHSICYCLKRSSHKPR